MSPFDRASSSKEEIYVNYSRTRSGRALSGNHIPRQPSFNNEKGDVAGGRQDKVDIRQLSGTIQDVLLEVSWFSLLFLPDAVGWTDKSL